MRDKFLSKAFRRIRLRLQPFFDEFSKLELENPIHESLLIGLNDGRPANCVEEIPNRDGVFQVMVGIQPERDDEKLLAFVFDAIERAVQACPFSKPDKVRVLEVLRAFRQK